MLLIEIIGEPRYQIHPADHLSLPYRSLILHFVHLKRLQQLQSQ